MPEEQTFMCVESVREPHCDRYVADLSRRGPVPAHRRRAADKARDRIEAAMPPGRDGPCEYDESSETCSMDILPPTARQVRVALRKAGYSAAVIRIARPDD